MFKKGDKVMYKTDVCIISDIRKNKFTNKDSYILSPIHDSSLTISVPINEKSLLRTLISKKEVEKLINEIPNIKVLDMDNKNIEIKYRNLLHSGKHEDLIKIIKTTYLRNQKRIENKRSKGQKDEEYFEIAERNLYNELSVVLNLSYEKTKKYVIDRVNKLV